MTEEATGERPEADATGVSPHSDVDAAVRVRGIYTTALTQLLGEAGAEIVQASDPIRERFGEPFPAAPADATAETSRDRQGIGLSGDPDAVDAVAAVLADVGIDALRWDAPAPQDAVYDAEILDAGGGSGATVDLGDGRRGYLRYGDVDGYVDAGNRYRVQVREPTPPWSDDEPRVAPALAVENGLCELSRDRSGVSAAFSGERATELVGMTELLSSDVPDGWGLRWQRSAADADIEAMGAALEDVAERARALESALADGDASNADADTSDDTVELDDPDPGEPAELAAPAATAWIWLGRESRFALDKSRRAVETTMPGHHRIKAADRAASAAVDFAEAVLGESDGADSADGDSTVEDDAADSDDAFPFAAVSRQFGPERGDRIELGHGKPDGRLISLGRGEITEWDAEGRITVERSMRGGGTYDALGEPIEDGDVAITKLREGRWWYPTTYRSAEGTSKGTYVNVCTPVELFPDCARYVDLHVDVIRRADGSVETVDEAELAAAVEDGSVPEPLAEKARTVAAAVERALSK
ncbi:DUF402 domain-containing protein [Halobacteria archaeon AArc-dxtr1]|nr:DUF402 domain-containing protein [Halobacteria archaeon AArc-dxtr1]